MERKIEVGEVWFCGFCDKRENRVKYRIERIEDFKEEHINNGMHRQRDGRLAELSDVRTPEEAALFVGRWVTFGHIPPACIIMTRHAGPNWFWVQFQDGSADWHQAAGATLLPLSYSPEAKESPRSDCMNYYPADSGDHRIGPPVGRAGLGKLRPEDIQAGMLLAHECEGCKDRCCRCAVGGDNEFPSPSAVCYLVEDDTHALSAYWENVVDRCCPLAQCYIPKPAPGGHVRGDVDWGMTCMFNGKGWLDLPACDCGAGEAERHAKTCARMKMAVGMGWWYCECGECHSPRATSCVFCGRARNAPSGTACGAYQSEPGGKGGKVTWGEVKPIVERLFADDPHCPHCHCDTRCEGHAPTCAGKGKDWVEMIIEDTDEWDARDRRRERRQWLDSLSKSENRRLPPWKKTVWHHEDEAD